MALVHEKILAVMKAVGVVAKTQKADPKMGGYPFRGIDDVMTALSPALVEAGLVIMPCVISHEFSEYGTSSGKKTLRTILEVTYTFMADDGTMMECTVLGEAGDKGVNQARSSAYKNAMFQAFHIATSEKKDTEHNETDMSGGKAKAEPKPTPPKPNTPLAGKDAVTPMRQAAMARCVELGLDPKTHGPVCLTDALRAVGVEDADAQNYTGKIGQLSAGDVVDLENTILNWKPQDSAPGFGEAA